MLAQLVGSDSVKNTVPLDWDRPFPIGVDRVFLAFAQQRKSVLLEVCDQFTPFVVPFVTIAKMRRVEFGITLNPYEGLVMEMET